MNLRKLLFRVYYQIERVIVPTLKHTQDIYEELLASLVNPNIKWLDLGCGLQVLTPWRVQEGKFLVGKGKLVSGIDYDLSSLKKNKNIILKVRGDITKLPYKSKTFDLVSSNMVVEHIDNPDALFGEVRRVLKSKGIFIYHTPNDSGYLVVLGKWIPDILKNKLIHLLQRRNDEDIFKTYYRMNNNAKIKQLALKSSFEIRKIKMTNSTAQFAVIPPLALLELLWIKMLMLKGFKSFRPYIIAILEKNAITE